MIPKRAVFYWEGRAMSWLRARSMESFCLLNPDWEIRLIDGSGLPIEPDSSLHIAHRSDWGRYRALHEHGGLYFDTDIVFTRPVPEEWLRHELVLSSAHVACLGSEKDDPWFRLLDSACADMTERGTLCSYQGMGINLVLRLLPNVQGRDVFWLDNDVLLPIPYNETERLWNDGVRAPDPSLGVGVHWYGGDHLSQQMEAAADAAWAAESNCLVARACRVAARVANAA